MLRKRQTVWAPNGWTFQYTIVDNPGAKNLDNLFGPGFIRHELRGPNEEDHLWIFDGSFELIPDPSHDDVPRFWKILSEIAISAYTSLSAESPNL